MVDGRYELVRSLGQGSFGHTFEARELESGRAVAIKVLDPQGSSDWKARELFEREASVLKTLRHQGIPQIHEVVTDQWEGAPATFLVMELVQGESLAALIARRDALDAPRVTDLFLELLGILEYLHTRVPPVLHRDIKPSNIIVRPDGFPSLVDFGSVRQVFQAPDEPGSTVAGTYGYMPYEQYMGQASPASDLYALAATFLHVLTGRLPKEFMSEEGRIAVPDTLPGDPRLGPIIARLLRPSPAERYAGARDVRQALLEPTAVVKAEAASLAPATMTAALAAPVPRAIEGETLALFKAVAPSALELMDSATKPHDEVGILDWAQLVFFSVVTAGVLPLVYISMARNRKRRLRRFLTNGLPATAEVLGIGQEKLPFDCVIARVSYEFLADGQLRRDSDLVLAHIAARWQRGDRVPVLYLADQGYDSVILATR